MIQKITIIVQNLKISTLLKKMDIFIIINELF